MKCYTYISIILCNFNDMWILSWIFPLVSEIGKQISEEDLSYSQTSLARTQHIKLGKYEVHCDGPCIKGHIHTSNGN